MTPRRRRIGPLKWLLSGMEPKDVRGLAVAILLAGGGTTAVGWRAEQKIGAVQDTMAAVRDTVRATRRTSGGLRRMVDSLRIEVLELRGEVAELRRAQRKTVARLPEHQVGPEVPAGWTYQPPRRRGFLARLFGG